MQRVVLSYRGRAVTEEDVEQIRGVLAQNVPANRRELSRLVCLAWDWRQPNGELRDAVCRGLLLGLHRAGHITLPEPQHKHVNLAAHRKNPKAVFVDQAPMEMPLRALGTLELQQVRRQPAESMFNSLLAQHHYLGYTQPVGEHLKYLVSARGRPVACLTWSSAPRHLGPRDRFIGWSMAARKRNTHLLAYNSRFLILPWVRVPYLASHLLSLTAKALPRDWQSLYSHPVYYLETFVDPERFRGTCYRAANWTHLGKTTGRGKDDLTHRQNRSLKDVWCYPLRRDFRQLLCGEA